MRKYKLVNPYLQGGISTVVESKNENDAAEQIWTNLSKCVVNIVPSFAFTIKDTKNNKLYSYSVSEEQIGGDKNKEVDYKIKPISIKEESTKRLVKSINKFEKIVNDSNSDSDNQKGGDKDKDDKDDEYKKLKKLYKKAKLENYINSVQAPIYYWWYNPLCYNIDYIYIPTFAYPLAPYVQIDLGTAWWY